jgi:hypothetical protein
MSVGIARRRKVLDQVAGCVLRDRASSYGDAEDNFADIAALASIVLARRLAAPLTAADVAAFCACIKLARIKASPEHLDNWVDLAGYAVCGGRHPARRGRGELRGGRAKWITRQWRA